MKKILCEIEPHGTIVDLIPFKRIDSTVQLELDRADILYAMKKGSVKAIINGQKHLITNAQYINKYMMDGVNGRRTVNVKLQETVEVEERIVEETIPEPVPTEETPEEQPVIDEVKETPRRQNTKNNKRR